MITSINFKLIPSDDFLTFGQRIVDYFDGKDLTGTGLEVFIANLKKTLIDFRNALERESKNPFTARLVKADDQRDESFYAFRDYAEACSHRNKTGWKEAAVKIVAIIRKYGWSAANFGYKTETAALINISTEIRSRYATELALIAGAEWLAEMDADQKSFEDVVKESASAGFDDSPIIRDTRPKLIDAIKSLLSMIPLQYKVSSNPVLVDYATSLNQLIEDTMTTARANATRAENKKKEDQNPKGVDK